MAHNIPIENSASKPLLPQVGILAGLAVLAIGGVTTYTLWQFQVIPSPASQDTIVTVPAIKTVTALGRLEPAGEVIKLSAPTSTDGSKVEQLLVKEGDRVKKGQVIAILDSRDRLQAAVVQAQEQVRIAEANLARVQAGAKSGEIVAQQATIARIAAERNGNLEAQSATTARLRAELQNAQIEDQRYQDLYREGAISASQRDSKRLALQTAQERLQEAEANLNRIRFSSQEQLLEARATLDRIAEVRPVDVEAAAAEVSYAQAAVQQAQANLDRAYVRSPMAAQILKVHTFPGELIGTEGIVELGQTNQMYAIAEVYESDISKVKVGQRARVSSDSLVGELQGTVDRVGLQVRRQNVVNTDPTANIDARVVEVRVKLDQPSSQQVAGFTNLQVKVVIEP